MTSQKLLRPDLGNLTYTTLPTDNSNIVFASPNRLGIADKIEACILSYKAILTRLPASSHRTTSDTIRIPKALLADLANILDVAQPLQLPKTNQFLSMINTKLRHINTDIIAVPRDFWDACTTCHVEISNYEKNSNIASAAARILAIPLAGPDVQSLPDENLNQLTALMCAENKNVWIDDDFKRNYSGYINAQLEPEEVLATTLDTNPMAIATSSGIAPSGMQPIDIGVNQDIILTSNIDKLNSIADQAYQGLLTIFSSVTLQLPINTMPMIYNGMESVQPIIHEGTLILLHSDAADSASLATVADLKKVAKLVTGKVMITKTVSLADDLDVTKSLLDQDWTLAVPEEFMLTFEDEHPVKEHANTLYKTRLNGQVHLSAGHPKDAAVLEALANMELNDGKRREVTGMITGRKYSAVRALSLAESLKTIWQKVVTHGLPTLSHVQTATNILGAGLGIIGNITGISGLTTASSVLNSLSNGLGEFIHKFTPTASDTTPVIDVTKIPIKARLLRNALTIMPNIIQAGKCQLELKSYSAVSFRLKALDNVRTVRNGYLSVQPEAYKVEENYNRLISRVETLRIRQS